MPTVLMPEPTVLPMPAPLPAATIKPPFRVLMVKLSSLGDVVHAMPAVQDMRRARPEVQVDWVVEKAFLPLVKAVQGIGQVIPCELRRWRHEFFQPETRDVVKAEWAEFRRLLEGTEDFPGYDAVIDAQGLTKSALVAAFAARSQTGRRFSLGNRTAGSSWERPTRWLSDVAIKLPVQIDAIERTRQLCARALGYQLEGLPLDYGLLKPEQRRRSTIKQVALVHGTSRADKLWPEDQWIAVALKLRGLGYRIVLPHGSDDEQARCNRIHAGIFAAARNTPHNAVTIWPRMPLHLLADALAGCWGVVGVDSGLSHIATALDLPQVQIYNFDTAWRTGPPLVEAWSVGMRRQVSVVGQGALLPSGENVAKPPDLDAVWRAWLRVGE